MTDATVADILNELADMYRMELRQENDIDANQLAESQGITSRQALNRMEQIAKKRPEYERVKVYDPDANARRWVLRKVA